MAPKIEQLIERLQTSVPAGLQVLLLFGSRARGDAHEGSDWDFGYLCSRELDSLTLRSWLSDIVESDRLDVVDLDRASGLLRIRAASEATLLLEMKPGTWHTFQEQAARFWCDAEPVLRSAYDHVLSSR